MKPHSKLIQTRAGQQKGAVLIEALVSILIMSFGLLGIAGLQTVALGFGKASWTTHRVSELVIDISERIRSNPVAAKLGQYTYTSSYATGSTATPTLINCHTPGTNCTAAQVATDDMANWLIKAQTILPNGSVHLTGDPQAGYVATALWADKDSTATPNICSATTDKTTFEWRNCCPSDASVSSTNGVKCYRAQILP